MSSLISAAPDPQEGCQSRRKRRISRHRSVGVVDELRLAHPARTIELAVVGSCAGSWDGDRLAQVVSNLVENALAHSPPDSPVSIAIKPTATHIELAVENRGEPIAPELMPTIFDAFRRGATKTKTKGREAGSGWASTSSLRS